MDLQTALKSKKARFGSWKTIYDQIITDLLDHDQPNDVKIKKTKTKKIAKDTKDTKDTKLIRVKKDTNSTDWYDMCMNDDICEKILPTLLSRKGTTLVFNTVTDSNFVKKHLDRYLRTIVMMTLYNVTCEGTEPIYVSNYDPDTDTVISYPVQPLMMAAFYGIQIKGILYINRLDENIISENYENSNNELFVREIDYEKLFNIPYDSDEEYSDGDEDFIKEINNKTVKDKKNNKKSKHRNIESDKSDKSDKSDESDENEDEDEDENSEKYKEEIRKLSQYPSSKYTVNLGCRITKKCTDTTTEGAHHCFGCDSKFIGYERHDNYPMHQQMFDFDKFIINIEENSDGTYTIVFDDNQHQSYKHASYSDLGYGSVISRTFISKPTCSWINSMKIKLSIVKNKYKFTVTHCGIDWF